METAAFRFFRAGNTRMTSARKNCGDLNIWELREARPQANLRYPIAELRVESQGVLALDLQLRSIIGLRKSGS